MRDSSVDSIDNFSRAVSPPEDVGLAGDGQGPDFCFVIGADPVGMDGTGIDAKDKIVFRRLGLLFQFKDWLAEWENAESSSHILVPSPHQIPTEVYQTRKPVLGVDVLFNHVEGEVVGPAERPDHEGKQRCRNERSVFQPDQREARRAYHDEQDGLQIHPLWILDVHGQVSK